MGLVIGIAYILFGVCYMAYKFYSEELHMSSAKSIGMVILGFAVFLIGGQILMALPEVLAGILMWGALICWALRKVFGSPAERQVHREAEERIARYTEDRNDALEDNEASFRKEWFRVNNEYLSVEETRLLCRARNGVVGQQIYYDVPWAQIRSFEDGKEAFVRSFIPDDILIRLSEEERRHLQVKLREHLFGGGENPIQNPGIESARQYIIRQFDRCPVKPFIPYSDVMKNPRLGLTEMARIPT